MYLCWPRFAANIVIRHAHLASFLSARQGMSVIRIARRACAALSLPGQLFLICLLLDTFYLACVYEAALLPSLMERENASDLNNSSADSLSSLKSSSSSSSSSSSLSSSSSVSLDSPVARTPSKFSNPTSSVSSASSSPSSSQRSSPLMKKLTGGNKDKSRSEIHNSRNSSSSANRTDSELLVSLSPEPEDTNSSRREGQKPPRHLEGEAPGGGGQAHSRTTDGGEEGSESEGGKQQQQAGSPTTHGAGKRGKEFPMALVVASSTAAVSILLFFCLSYLWHTRQLDRRAQKLAIRLAAEVDDVKCNQCRTPPVASLPARRPGSSLESASDSGGEESSCVLPTTPTVLDELNSLNEEDEEDDERDVGADGSRRKPGGVGRTLGSRRGSRGRSRRSGSRSSRKWSGHSGGQQGTRSSLVTDQEILNHFASRRHSTFFI